MEEQTRRDLSDELDKEKKKENSDSKVIKNLDELLEPDLRFANIMKTLMFTNKILIRGDGQMVAVARVVLPEYINKEELKRDDDELGMSTHRFKIDDDHHLTIVVFTCLQEQFKDPKKDKTSQPKPVFFLSNL